MQQQQLKNILEAILLTAEHPMDIRKLEAVFDIEEEQVDRPSRDNILQALQALQSDYEGRGVELKEVANGYRMQVIADTAKWVSRMWEEKPPRYSRALLETLVLIAYRQPITRGEIEEIRGVSVSSHIVKTLTEREWVRVLGHKDVPGRPSLYGTTREFLDYFNLKSLDELPSLADITDLDKLHPELALEPNVAAADGEEEAEDQDVEQDNDTPIAAAEVAEDSDDISENDDTPAADMTADDVIDEDEEPLIDNEENAPLNDEAPIDEIDADEAMVDEAEAGETPMDDSAEEQKPAS